MSDTTTRLGVPSTDLVSKDSGPWHPALESGQEAAKGGTSSQVP